MKRILKMLLELVYPRRCSLCDRLLSRNEIDVCKKCLKEIHFIKERTCSRCGRVLHSRFEELCFECTKNSYSFDEAFAPFKYTGRIRDSILRLKYEQRAHNSIFLAKCIWKYGRRKIELWKPDMIIPVPIHHSRLASRGYNQAFLLAKKLSQLSGIPIGKDVVIRVKKTEAQKKLGRSERKKNLESAFFYCYKGSLPENILIVDDIFTTGSTVDAISKLLKEKGAKHIYVVCAAVS